MLTLFENHTTPLNEYEYKILLPKVLAGLKNHPGKHNAITSKEIVFALNKQGLKINGERLRKVIHHIREEGLLFCVMGTSAGYYVSKEPNDIKKQIDSFRGREIAMRNIRVKTEQLYKEIVDGKK